MTCNVQHRRRPRRRVARTTARAIAAVVVGGLLLSGCARAVDERVDAANDDVYAQLPSLDPEIDAWPSTVVTIRPAQQRAATAPEDAVAIAVRVADTPQRRTRGFMHVEHIPDDAGLLFVYDDEHSGAFWMADTLVALDIAFIDRHGTIIAMESMTPCEQQPCVHYAPKDTYRAALEVAAGWFGANDIAVGDAVTWSPPTDKGPS